MKLLFLFCIGLLTHCSSGGPSAGPPGPVPQTCLNTKGSEYCDYHQYSDGYCAWNSSSLSCQVITSCAQIPTRQVCDSNFPSEFSGCVWQVQNGPCFKAEEGGCKVLSNVNFGGGQSKCIAKTGCYWTPAQGSTTGEGECQLATSCDQLTGSGEDTCNNFNNKGLSCYWDKIGNGSCKAVSQTTPCSSIPVESKCTQHQYTTSGGTTEYCYWALATICKKITQCSDITAQSVANPASDCSTVQQPLGCDWDTQTSQCVFKCGNYGDAGTCNKNQSCGWDQVTGGCYDAKTRCGQITGLNGGQTTCDTSTLTCLWDTQSSQCKNDTRTCQEITSCAQESVSACTSAGCTLTSYPPCSAQTDNSGCTALPGCSWVVCSSFTSQMNCQAQSGCSWVTPSCSAQTTQKACAGVAGCQWTTTPQSCAGLSQIQCNSHSGCTFQFSCSGTWFQETCTIQSSVCSGDPYCTGTTQQSCTGSHVPSCASLSRPVCLTQGYCKWK